MEPVPLRIGDLDDGPVATVGRGGVVDLGDVTVEWWVGAEDRWHVPGSDASTRDRRVDGTPVLESLVRVPSGDAAGRVGAARPAGRSSSSIVVEVENRSPVPLALAVVVRSGGTIDASTRTIRAGSWVVTLDRDAFDRVEAPDDDAALAALTERTDVVDRPAVGGGEPSVGRSGVTVLVAPLPHTAVASLRIDPAVEIGECSDHVPDLDRVVAGWQAHLAAAPAVETGDETFEAAMRSAVCDLLLDPSAGSIVVAALAGAPVDGRLAQLVARQRLNGAVRDDDPVGATCALLAGLGAWWDGGGSPAAAEPFVVAALAGARWLGAPRRGRAIDGREAIVRDALDAIVGLLADLDQADAATDVAALAARIAGTAAGVAEVGEPWVSDEVVASPDRFVAALRGAAVATPDGIRLLDAWRPTMLGRSVDVRNLPTRWGRVAYGVRWHGDRPALLWELEPWPDRTVPDDLRVTAPSVDPSWSADVAAREALLASPGPAAAFT